MIPDLTHCADQTGENGRGPEDLSWGEGSGAEKTMIVSLLASYREELRSRFFFSSASKLCPSATWQLACSRALGIYVLMLSPLGANQYILLERKCPLHISPCSHDQASQRNTHHPVPSPLMKQPLLQSWCHLLNYSLFPLLKTYPFKPNQTKPRKPFL